MVLLQKLLILVFLSCVGDGRRVKRSLAQQNVRYFEEWEKTQEVTPSVLVADLRPTRRVSRQPHACANLLFAENPVAAFIQCRLPSLALWSALPPKGLPCIKRHCGCSLVANANADMTHESEVMADDLKVKRYKIFVGGVGNSSDEEFRNHFAFYGELADWVVMRQEDGKSRGFGFVEYDDQMSAEGVLQDADNHVIEGRKLQVKRVEPKQDAELPTRKSSRRKRKRDQAPRPPRVMQRSEDGVPEVAQVHPERYDELLKVKVTWLEEMLANATQRPIEELPRTSVFESERENFRMRTCFSMWREEDEVHYVMFNRGDSRTPHQVVTYPMGSKRINELMPIVRDALNANFVLRNRINDMRFVTTLTGDSLITITYNTPIGEEWTAAANELFVQLGGNVQIVGRSRKVKVVIGSETVSEALEVAGRGTCFYTQVEGAFTQPNAHVCEKMLAWAYEVTSHLNASTDLCELYCGNGCFTVALAPNFRHVVATEISGTSVKLAEKNLAANGCTNVKVAKLSAEDFSKAWFTGERFQRLVDAGIHLRGVSQSRDVKHSEDHVAGIRRRHSTGYDAGIRQASEKPVGELEYIDEEVAGKGTVSSWYDAGIRLVSEKPIGNFENSDKEVAGDGKVYSWYDAGIRLASEKPVEELGQPDDETSDKGKVSSWYDAGIRLLSNEPAAEDVAGERQVSSWYDAGIRLVSEDYKLETLFVDPPRSGLDSICRNLAAKFERVVYVSCNPETLARDVSELTLTHELTRVAAFDQFPYTPHLEAGVVLERRRSPTTGSSFDV